MCEKGLPQYKDKLVSAPRFSNVKTHKNVFSSIKIAKQSKESLFLFQTTKSIN